MRIEKDLIRKVLEKLYENYFPHSCFLKTLRGAMGTKPDEKYLKPLLTVCIYLNDKGLTTEEGENKWRITAKGIDFLEGKSLI